MLQVRRLTRPDPPDHRVRWTDRDGLAAGGAGPGRPEHRRVPERGDRARAWAARTDPSNLVAVGQSVCPMLSEPGQNAADVAAQVADTTGMSLGGANMFTGLAISFLCPRVLESVGSGESPIPLGLLGF